MNGRVAVAALACVLALAACKKAAEPRMKSSDIAQASGESSDRDDDSGGPAQDACGLLEPSEVEVVLGPLAGAPFRVQANNNKPDMRGDGCRYEGRDLRSISLDMNRTGGAALMKMMGLPAKIARDVNIKGQLPKGALPEDVRIAGEWDEIRIMGCCRLNAVLGDALVVLEFSGSRATMEQAVTLLNKALLRLDKTLPISGRPGGAAAEQRRAARPRPRHWDSA